MGNYSKQNHLIKDLSNTDISAAGCTLDMIDDYTSCDCTAYLGQMFNSRPSSGYRAPLCNSPDRTFEKLHDHCGCFKIAVKKNISPCAGNNHSQDFTILRPAYDERIFVI